jgi:hypothetical protein
MQWFLIPRTEGALSLCAPPARSTISDAIQTFHVWLPSARRCRGDAQPPIQDGQGSNLPARLSFENFVWYFNV